MNSKIRYNKRKVLNGFDDDKIIYTLDIDALKEKEEYIKIYDKINNNQGE